VSSCASGRSPGSGVRSSPSSALRSAYSYVLLVTDRYPAFDGDWYVQYDVEPPDRLSRWKLVFWKLFASIPHFIVLGALAFVLAICTVIGWFAILVTGRFPKALRDFVLGWLRWSARVTAYFSSLRDEFPPFSLSPTATAGTRRGEVISGIGGFALLAVAAGAFVAVLLAFAATDSADVNYDQLVNGSASETLDVANVRIQLINADDNYDFPGDILSPQPGRRFVAFTMAVANQKIADFDFETDDFDLDGEPPVLLSVGGTPPPVTIKKGQGADVLAVFEVDTGKRLDDLTVELSGLRKARFVFH
jgi:hypothetical protein